jgi:hypothetical protein
MKGETSGHLAGDRTTCSLSLYYKITPKYVPLTIRTHALM